MQDISVADLIQHYCQDRKTAQLVIKHNGDQATFYFKDGNVVHAVMDDIQGEEVVYQILDWKNGSFNIEMGVNSSTETISRKWTGLLLEGARRLDEGNHLQTTDTEVKTMATKKKSEQLAEMLQELLENSSDLEGAAIVGVDGLVYSANVPQKTIEADMVGASSAAILGLSKRSAEQLKRGTFTQTLIQGEKGNVIVSQLNDTTLFVGLTPKNINLGMAFAETNAMIEQLSKIM